MTDQELDNKYDFILDTCKILRDSIDSWINGNIKNKPILTFGRNVDEIKNEVIERVNAWGKPFIGKEFEPKSKTSGDQSKSIPLNSDKLSFILIGRLIYKQESDSFGKKDLKWLEKFYDITNVTKIIFDEIKKFTTFKKIELEYLPLLNIKLPECSKDSIEYCLTCENVFYNINKNDSEKLEIRKKQDKKCFFRMHEVTDKNNKDCFLKKCLWYLVKDSLGGKGELCIVNCNVSCLTNWSNKGGKLSINVESLILIPNKYSSSSGEYSEDDYNDIIYEINNRNVNHQDSDEERTTKKQKTKLISHVIDREDF